VYRHARSDAFDLWGDYAIVMIKSAIASFRPASGPRQLGNAVEGAGVFGLSHISWCDFGSVPHVDDAYVDCLTIKDESIR
jgi:hypothetical protein